MWFLHMNVYGRNRDVALKLTAGAERGTGAADFTLKTNPLAIWYKGILNHFFSLFAY
jgi:hypothetical protein